MGSRGHLWSADAAISNRLRRESVDSGFRNAMSAIVDSNVTTAITALVLYLVGTGPVEGFAVTLLIGIFASTASAGFVTRTIFLLWLRRGARHRKLSFRSIRLFERRRFDFIGVRRWAYGLTGLLIVPGMLLLAVRGATYSIEFTGGVMSQVRTAAPTEAGRLREALAAGGYPDAEIQSFGSDRDYVVRARNPEHRPRRAKRTPWPRACAPRSIGVWESRATR